MSDREIIELKFKIERKHGSGKIRVGTFFPYAQRAGKEEKGAWKFMHDERKWKKSSSFRLNRENEDLCSIWKCAMFGEKKQRQSRLDPFFMKPMRGGWVECFSARSHTVSCLYMTNLHSSKPKSFAMGFLRKSHFLHSLGSVRWLNHAHNQTMDAVDLIKAFCNITQDR